MIFCSLLTSGITMLTQSRLEIRVSIDVGCYQHAVAVGLSTGELIDEFEIDHNQTGFDDFLIKSNS